MVRRVERGPRLHEREGMKGRKRRRREGGRVPGRRRKSKGKPGRTRKGKLDGEKERKIMENKGKESTTITRERD